jgi:hypothetical protein
MVKYDKHELVKVILKELPSDSPYHIMDIDAIVSKWFASKRSASGLLLTLEGKLAFDVADIEYQDFELPWPTIFRNMITFDMSLITFSLTLAKQLNCPYWIYDKQIAVETSNSKNIMETVHYVRIYDESVAFCIGLYGDIGSYLKSLDKE